jgi:hypothetical protein
VAHESEIALVGLDDGRRFEIVLVEPVNDFVEPGDVFVERREVHIATFSAVTVRVEGV